MPLNMLRKAPANTSWVESVAKKYDHREAMSEILWQAGATVGDQVGFGVAISRGMCNIV